MGTETVEAEMLEVSDSSAPGQQPVKRRLAVP